MARYGPVARIQPTFVQHGICHQLLPPPILILQRGSSHLAIDISIPQQLFSLNLAGCFFLSGGGI
jgi:hypothetical protein